MASNPTWVASPDQLGSTPQNVVHAMIEALIEWCDGRDGDPDIEANGDELDGSMGEDEFVSRGFAWASPGCPISDVGEDDDPGGGNVTDEPHDAEDSDNGERAAWPERIDQTRFPGTHPRFGGWHVGEDDEDDDRDSCLAADDDPKRRIRDGRPGGSYDTEPNGDEGDYGGEVSGI